MSAAPGWYPDPAGRAGYYRYWDGQTWSAATTTRPNVPPAAAGLDAGSVDAPARTLLLPGVSPGGGLPVAPRPRRWAWLAATALALAVLIVVVVLVVRSLTPNVIVDGEPSPGGSTSTEVCPDTPGPEPSTSPTGRPDGRVHSGRLSFPYLPEPFSPPYHDQRVPFGRDVQEQQATVQADANGTPVWVASVLVARLLAGDGFFGPEQGAKVVAECVVGKLYGDVVIQRTDQKNEPMTVDGHPAWTIEAHLGFDIPGIEAKGETMIIVVVDTGGEAGLFFASIPDTSPQFMAPARASEAALKVG